MQVYVLFYDDGEDGPDHMVGIYQEKETAEADIIPNAKKYGSDYDCEQRVKSFYIEEIDVI